MILGRPVRLPLQVGIAASRRLALGALASLGGSLALVALPGVGAPVVLGLLGLSLAFAGAAARYRASDAVLDAEGLHIEGGPLDAARIAWSEIAEHGPALERGDDAHELRLSAGGVLLARARGVEDARALDVVVELMDAARGIVPKGPPDGDVSLLRCGACGASVAPADEEQVPCHFCRKSVAVPASLREQLRISATVGEGRARIDRRLRALFTRPPGALATNVALGVFSALAPLALCAAGVFVAFDHAELVPLAVGALALGVVLARVRVGRRRLLYAITAGFCANAPAREGAPPTCRLCLAPLPAGDPARIAVRCVYCNAENVLGIDPRPQAKRVGWETSELEGAFGQRDRERVLFAALLAVGTALVVASVALRRPGPWVMSSWVSPQGTRSLHANARTTLLPRAHAEPRVLLGASAPPVAHEIERLSPHAARAPALSPDGKVLLVTYVGAGKSGIVALDPVTGALLGTRSPIDDADAPFWLRAGAFGYTAGAHGTAAPATLFVVDGAPGSGANALALGVWGRAAAAPTGDRVVVTKPDGASSAVFVVRVSDSGMVRIGAGRDPAWSPDGRTLALVRPTAKAAELALVDAQSAHVERTLSLGTDAAFPCFSPDGQWLAFVIPASRELWVIDRSGDHEARLASNAHGPLAWGRGFIYFTAGVPDDSDLEHELPMVYRVRVTQLGAIP